MANHFLTASQTDFIFSEETGEIVASVIYYPELVGEVLRPYRLIMEGVSLGFFATKDDINEAVRFERGKKKA